MSLDGIDISGYQRGIDLARVPHDFMIAYGTGGASIESPRALAWVEEERALGGLPGLYHYAGDDGRGASAADEAAIFIRMMRSALQGGHCMAMLDWEGVALRQGPGWAYEWLDRVEQALGLAPLFYSYAAELRVQDYTRIAARWPLFLASYYDGYNGRGYQPDVGMTLPSAPWDRYVMRQYTGQGRLPGWAGIPETGHYADLDLNRWAGSRDDWIRMATPRGGAGKGEMSGDELAYWLDFYGNRRRRSNAYGAPPPPGVSYDKGYHRGEDFSNGGMVSNVPALTDGTVVGTGRSGVIGFFIAVVYDTAPDRVFVYCHMHDGSALRSGRVSQGQIIGRTAAAHEFPGTGWTGPHLHLVATTHADGGHNTSRADFDPNPIINRILENTMDELIRKLLNTPAYDGGPSLSQTLKDIHTDVSNVFHGVFTGGPSMKDGGKAISQSLADISAKVGKGSDATAIAAAIRDGLKGATVASTITDADLKRIESVIAKAPSGEVDVTKLAKAVREQFTNTPLR